MGKDAGGATQLSAEPLGDAAGLREHLWVSRLQDWLPTGRAAWTEWVFPKHHTPCQS